MGYYIQNLTSDLLLDFVNVEYDYVKWDPNSVETGDNHIALWGWNQDGTYEVALGLQIKDTDTISIETEINRN